MIFWKTCFAVLVIALISCQSKDSAISPIKIVNEHEDAQVKYAIRKLQELDGNGLGLTIKTRLDNGIPNEAYEVVVENDIVLVTGGDASGLMYGLLEIRDQLSSAPGLKNKKESPQLKFRAIKFNLPWDSYRHGEALSLHYETCRDTLFWESFLDMMVDNRFNKLTLWNLHPFNYLVKTEKYPEANGFSDDEMEKWETFWHTLFTMAKNRGIETYLVNWNIFVSPEFAEAHQVAEYSIDHTYFHDGDTSALIKDYTRESVKAVIDKYPNLTGLGITLGEGMGGMTAPQREQWLLDAYIEGIRMASRKIKFIHRVPLSAGTGSGGSTSQSVEQMTRQTLDTLTCFDGPINIELKFNWSHGHSTPDLVKVHGGKLSDTYWNPMPENYRLAWMIRNEDFFMLRWGQTDFIRQHIAQNAHQYVNGYFVGSECYIPARDYITKLPGTSYTYAFERQWMFYKSWGRLLYNPETSEDYFSGAFESRFPGFGDQLFSAQRKVSKVPLIVASFMNATWDFTLYSEGLLERDSKKGMKLISLSTICNKQPMDPGYMGVNEYLNRGEMKSKITPIKLADSIRQFCQEALGEVEGIVVKNNVDLLYEVSDIKAWAYIGMYFANKLEAAVAYQQYLNTGNRKFLSESIEIMEKGLKNWKELTTVTTPIYDPVPLMHYDGKSEGYFHWSRVEEEVLEEISSLSVN